MKLKGPLKPGEHTLVATRAHGVLLLRPLGYLLGAMAAWSFASALGVGLPWVRYPALILAVWLAWVGVRGIVSWVTTSYLVTTDRLLIQRGLGAGGLDVEVPLSEIEGVRVGRKHLVGAVDAASLVVVARGGQQTLSAVPEPERFSTEIRQAQNLHFTTGRAGTLF